MTQQKAETMDDVIERLEGRCATCEHWFDAEDDWQFERLKMGRCLAIKQREDVLEPARAMDLTWEAREAEEERLMTQQKAIAVDGSGYRAQVYTQGDFGCVLHALKSREQSPR